MSHYQRTAKGVYFAQRLAHRPPAIPIGRPRGAKLAGVRYERAFGKALGQLAQHGPWFQFRDMNGIGHCQPDFIIELPSLVVILECKYTWTLAAFVQMEALYAPVLSFALGKPVIGLQVCKRLLPEAQKSGKIVSMLGNGLILANSGARVTLHWQENTPVMLRPSQDQLSVLSTRTTAQSKVASAEALGL